MAQKRTGYPSDVSDEEWALCAPYLVLIREDVPQRTYALRAVFNAVRYLVKAGCGWRMLPNDFPPWPVVHQQAQRWIKAGRFEAMAHDLREVLRVAAGRAEQPSAVTCTGSSWRSSNSTTPNTALCCCPDAGSSNEPLAGPLASAVSHATTSDWPLPSWDSTGSLSSASCSKISLRQVHDSL